jgi:hypothetical protein
MTVITVNTATVKSTARKAYEIAREVHRWDVEVFTPTVRFTWQVASPYAWEAFKTSVVFLAGFVAYCYCEAPGWLQRSADDTEALCWKVTDTLEGLNYALINPSQALEATKGAIAYHAQTLATNAVYAYRDARSYAIAITTTDAQKRRLQYRPLLVVSKKGG